MNNHTIAIKPAATRKVKGRIEIEVKLMVSVELNTGQMVQDVKLALIGN